MPNLLIPFRFALGLAALLAGVWLVYAPGLNAAFRLDDFQNLGLLDQVVDLDTLLLFVTSGSAGPGGRPVALASFLLNQVAWPVDPSAFLKTNLQIHLLNGVLLAWLTLQLARHYRRLGLRPNHHRSRNCSGGGANCESHKHDNPGCTHEACQEPDYCQKRSQNGHPPRDGRLP